MSNRYTLDDFDFHLPEELIAQRPSSQRGGSRLFHLERDDCRFTHRWFREIPSLLKEGDLLVVNAVQVLQARVHFIRSTGGRVEFLFTERLGEDTWKTVSNRTSRLLPGERLTCEKERGLTIEILGREDDHIMVKTSRPMTAELFSKVGSMPLPPYIRREADREDTDRYQTVYAGGGEAVAAPTAGLHFTPEILEEVRRRGITISPLYLDVSWGTFRPVRSRYIDEHRMHSENFFLPDETVRHMERTRERGGRIVAVGTTVLRVLESVCEGNSWRSGKGSTDIFIYPPRNFSSVDALVTNFHTPGSTLLMLVAAFAGYGCIMEAYREAVREKYRFFSYGDAMFIE
jgi:S-adenosylmethionine:tRNA ribosyltransferase-isomerase